MTPAAALAAVQLVVYPWHRDVPVAYTAPIFSLVPACLLSPFSLHATTFAAGAHWRATPGPWPHRLDTDTDCCPAYHAAFPSTQEPE